MVQAQILYQNLLAPPASVTYSGTVVVGFDPINAYDWRDFTLFQSQAAATLVLDMASASAWSDSIVIWGPASAGTNGVTVEQSNDGTTWTDPLVTGNMPLANPYWFNFAFTKRYLRLTFAGAAQYRQITVGTKLTFPMGQWLDVSPPMLVQGVVVENQISVNGSIIGRNLRRFEKTGQLSLDYLSQSWVRSVWDPFVQSAIRYPFWWRWNPVGYPTEIGFAVADSINAPKNTAPLPTMHADMNIKFLTQ